MDGKKISRSETKRFMCACKKRVRVIEPDDGNGGFACENRAKKTVENVRISNKYIDSLLTGEQKQPAVTQNNNKTYDDDNDDFKEIEKKERMKERKKSTKHEINKIISTDGK